MNKSSDRLSLNNPEEPALLCTPAPSCPTSPAPITSDLIQIEEGPGYHPRPQTQTLGFQRYLRVMEESDEYGIGWSEDDGEDDDENDQFGDRYRLRLSHGPDDHEQDDDYDDGIITRPPPNPHRISIHAPSLSFSAGLASNAEPDISLDSSAWGSTLNNPDDDNLAGVCFDPSGRWMYVGTQKSVSEWDLQGGSVAMEWEGLRQSRPTMWEGSEWA